MLSLKMDKLEGGSGIRRNTLVSKQQPHFCGNWPQLLLCPSSTQLTRTDNHCTNGYLGLGRGAGRPGPTREDLESLWRLNREEGESGKSLVPVHASSACLDNGPDTP